MSRPFSVFFVLGPVLHDLHELRAGDADRPADLVGPEFFSPDPLADSFLRQVVKLGDRFYGIVPLQFRRGLVEEEVLQVCFPVLNLKNAVRKWD